jgi:hypothetical protein
MLLFSLKTLAPTVSKVFALANNFKLQDFFIKFIVEVMISARANLKPPLISNLLVLINNPPLANLKPNIFSPPFHGVMIR